MNRTFQDIRYELRSWRKNPGFTLVVLLVLALGTGANAVMFSIIDSVLLRPLSYSESERLMSLGTVNTEGPTDSASWLNFKDWSAQAQSFSGMAAYDEEEAAVQIPAQQPLHVTVVETSANLFQLLGVQPAIGRGFLPGEDQEGKPCAAVLNAGFWQTQFHASRSALGERINLNGTLCTVVGVMPQGFQLPPHDPALWFTLHPSPSIMGREVAYLEVIARLRPSATRNEAQQELNIVGARLAKTYAEDKDTGIAITPYQEKVTKKARPALLALQGAVALLLLITCANVANLQLASALSRQREFAIRSALGAAKTRLVRQLLTEKLALVLVATGLGLGLAYGSLGFLKSLGAKSIPRINEVSLHAEVYLAMLGISVLTALAFGLTPVFQTARQEIEPALRENGSSVSGSRGKRVFRDALVVSQLSLAILLLACSGLLMRALLRLLNEDRGFVAEHILRMQTSPSANLDKRRDLASTLYAPELEKVREVPGVKSAAFVTYLPLSEEAGNTHVGFSIVGQPTSDQKNPPLTLLNAISEDYFRVLQIPLLHGRFFQPDDALDHPPVAIVNDAFIKKYMGGEDSVGKHIELSGLHLTIIGVVRDTRQQTLALPTEPEIYLSFRQIPPDTVWTNVLLKQIMTMIARTQGDPAAPSRAVQAAIHGIDPDQAVYHVESMEDVIAASVSVRRLGFALVAVLAGLALIIASAGVCALLSYAVSQRIREIAVRIAVGANRNDMIRMVMLRALWLCALSLGIGVGATILCGRFLTAVLAGIQPWDPPVVIGTSLILFLITVLASLYPALRAASVQPVLALRAE